jgi:hypothetical protein
MRETKNNERNPPVAKQTIVTITDDLDGSEADETLSFALDGNGYEIDLNSKHAKELRDFLETYIDAGTRTGRVGSGAQLQRLRPSAAPSSLANNRERNQAIREWAAANNYELNDRGRIPQNIVDAYDNRNNAKSVVSAVKKAAGSKTVSFKPEKRSA